jgi:hypothetical protein
MLCECGCGKDAGLFTDYKRGHKRGDPRRFILGHNTSVLKHGMSRTPEWDAYVHAQQRCNNPKNISYVDYGGRGIKFLFTSFEQFFAELGFRPDGKSLDRYPSNDGHYEPGNVRWATAVQQANNKRSLKGRPWSEARRKAQHA